MPKSVRTKVEFQEDRLYRELDGALAKPHPEAVGPASDELGSSVETAQIADVSPSEVAERRGPEGQDSMSDTTEETKPAE